MKTKILGIILLVIVLLIIAFFISKKVSTPKTIIEPISEEQKNEADKKITLGEEKTIVEKYVRDNIKNIATNQPVLGGTWYVVSIDINPEAKSGDVVYEDGHIQSNADFTYTFADQKVAITEWVVGK